MQSKTRFSECTASRPPQESLVRDGTRTSLPTKPSPNPDNAGQIVHCLMGLPVVASCHTARDRTRICSDTPSTAVPRPLCHSGGPKNSVFKWHTVSDKMQFTLRLEYGVVHVFTVNEPIWQQCAHTLIQHAFSNSHLCWTRNFVWTCKDNSFL